MGAYWPGNDASGPNKSLKGLCTALNEGYEFHVVARDRALGSSVSLLPNRASTSDWHDLGFAQFRWLKPKRFGLEKLLEVVRRTSHDALLLNGFFDREITLPLLLARKTGIIPRVPTILAPRGEFSPGALSIKTAQKRAWLAAARALGVLSDVTLHATSMAELADIRRSCWFAGNYAVAGNIVELGPEPEHRAAPAHTPLRLVFVGRISPVKNVDVALRVLAHVSAPCRFDIVGPIENAEYWEGCVRQIARLPPHIEVRHRGQIGANEMSSLLAEQDLFFLPTKSENFGHAIFEALTCGVPCIISNTTPWRGLRVANAGVELPLGEPEIFAREIDRFATLGESERKALRAGARSMAERAHAKSSALRDMDDLLRSAIEREATTARAA